MPNGVEARRVEHEREALAQRYGTDAQSTANPIAFEQYILFVQKTNE